MSVPNSDFFVVGGALRPDADSYVKRSADEQLLKSVQRGKFCYVLTARQMGKTSLMHRIASRLEEEEACVVRIDLNIIGTSAAQAPTWLVKLGHNLGFFASSVKEWYLSLLWELSSQLDLSIDPGAWWEKDSPPGRPVFRFISFLRDVVLTEIQDKQVIIFVDEIDYTLNFNFSDDFFAAIRSIYNARPQEPAFERLIFVLLGVATPPDLIKDRTRTPFNIGQPVALQDFNRDQANVLIDGLEKAYPQQGRSLFERIYDWSDGHPYLTQKLCKEVVEGNQQSWQDEQIEALVNQTFFSGHKLKDDNLLFVRDRILNHPQQRQLLGLYRQVYEPAKKVADNPQSSLQNQLKLSGLVKVDQEGHLQLRNKIYREAFDLAWVQENTQRDWRGIIAFVAVMVTFLTLTLTSYVAWHDNVHVPEQADDAELAFFRASNYPEKQLPHLADLFELQGILSPIDYDYRAIDLFKQLSREEQSALFRIDKPSDSEKSDLIVVIKDLYVAIADVDDTDTDRELLEEMRKALKGNFNASNKNVYNLNLEISYWLEGRKLAQEGQSIEALNQYNEAINLNDQHLGMLFERARLLTKEPRYEVALDELERILAIVQNATIPPTATPTPMPSAPPATVTPTSTVITSPTSPPSQSSPSPVPSASSDVPVTATPTVAIEIAPTPTLTPTPSTAPSFTLEFDRPGRIREAVENFMRDHPSLMSELVIAVAQDPNKYQNLQDFNLVPVIPTSTPTDTPLTSTDTPIVNTKTPEPVVIVATEAPIAVSKPTITVIPTGIASATIPPPTDTPIPPPTDIPISTLGIGSTTISEKDGMTLLYVPEGDFEMGSADDDSDADDDEKPRHTVNLTAYWIDQTEVTNAMFAKFLNEMGNEEEEGTTWLEEEDSDVLIEQVNGTFQPKEGVADHPVIEVSWYGATAYCQWAGRRLPTEAEWEKAAGGTDGRKWPWDNEPPTGDLANICDVHCEYSGDESIDDGYGRTSPVGNYPNGASPYGALDMAGNVREWVNDFYDPSYYENSPNENPQGPTVSEAKVVRGGSWNYTAQNARARDRDSQDALDRGQNRGFRCAFSYPLDQ